MYESFWSITHKFSDLNVCQPSEISSIFTCKQKSVNYLYDTNVLKKQWIDNEKFKRALHLSEGILENAFLDNFLFKDEIDWFTCQTLRFCPHCISQGFHSVFHQMVFVKQCPFHRVDLEEDCPNCQRPISMHFNRKDFKKPYSCPGCHYRFYNPVSDEIWVPGRGFYRSFGEIGTLLKRRKEALPKRFNLKLLDANAETRTGFDALSGKIFRLWKTLYSRADNATKNNYRWDFAVYETNNKTPCQEFFDEITTYKAFNRFLGKLIKAYHPQCFEIMKEKQWTIIRSGVIKGIYVCPIIKAYLVWRQYWEGDDKALYRFQQPYQRLKYKNLCIKTYDYYLNQWLGSHVLWEELAGTFLEALHMVSVTEDLGVINRYPVRLYGNSVPYWESYYDPKTRVRRFFHTGRSNLKNCLENIRH